MPPICKQCHIMVHSLILKISSNKIFFSSDDRDSTVEVKIEKDDSLCKLRVKKAKIEDHDGLWDVEITGKCNEEVR